MSGGMTEGWRDRERERKGGRMMEWLLNIQQAAKSMWGVVGRLLHYGGASVLHLFISLFPSILVLQLLSSYLCVALLQFLSPLFWQSTFFFSDYVYQLVFTLFIVQILYIFKSFFLLFFFLYFQISFHSISCLFLFYALADFSFLSHFFYFNLIIISSFTSFFLDMLLSSGCKTTYVTWIRDESHHKF